MTEKTSTSTSDEPFAAGQRVVVQLPHDVAGWYYPEGATWTGTVIFVNGDSIDVEDDDGLVEPIDREYVKESHG